MRQRLSKRKVDALRPAARDVLAWDRELPRFGVKVSRGGAKSYVVQYRASGRVRRYTIGRHGAPWTPDTARAEALRVLEAVARGKDPAGAKIGARTAPTVAALEWRASLSRRHVAAKCETQTRAETPRTCKALILPPLGPRHVADVQPTRVARLHHNHGARRPAKPELTSLAICGKLFRLRPALGVAHQQIKPSSTHKKSFREANFRTLRMSGEEELNRLRSGLRADRTQTPQAPNGRGPAVSLHRRRHPAPAS